MDPSTANRTPSSKVFASLLPLQRRTGAPAVTSDLPSGLELPGINYKFNSKKYRFFYGSRVEVSPHPYKVRTSSDIVNGLRCHSSISPCDLNYQSATVGRTSGHDLILNSIPNSWQRLTSSGGSTSSGSRSCVFLQNRSSSLPRGPSRKTTVRPLLGAAAVF